MAVARARRLPPLQLSLNVPARAAVLEPAFRLANPPQSASTPLAWSSQFRLADFDKLEILGRGNAGMVYKVRHRETSALYALKVLHHHHDAAAAEADILAPAAGASPHVLRCHSVIPAPSGDVALLLELADGGSLDAVRRRRGAFPEAAVAEVAAQALSGLAHLHARRIVHRDVKPANLLVTAAGEVSIADFGIARVLSRAGDQCAAYCPERLDTERHGHADPRAADVWGLGVTVLKLLMGRYPLLPAGQKPTWAGLMCAICFGELPALPDGVASPELREFLAACLHKDYTKRASAAQLLAHPFIAGRDVTVSKDALRWLVAGA